MEGKNVNKSSTLLTIITPTFNREKLLKKCYESLCNQTEMEFKWLIVDDGSQDKTSAIVNNFIKEGKVSVQYLKKNNGGKHTAINYGMQYVNSKMTMILDSDDWLLSNAVETILGVYQRYKNEDTVCGFTFLKQNTDGNIMGDIFPKEKQYNYIDWRLNGVVSGEYCDVIYTEVMLENPFSEYDGEKYIGESTVWIRIAEKYDMCCVNKSIYVAEYMNDGLTKGGRKMRVSCPNGGMEYSNLCMKKRCSYKVNVRGSILYVAYAKMLNKNFVDIVRKSNASFYTTLLYPAGFYVCLMWKKNFLNTKSRG